MTKISRALMFLVALSLGVFIWELSPPTQWSNVDKGMTSDEVQGLIGRGSGEFKGLKGPFWRRGGILVWHEMEVHFDVEDRAKYINRQRYVGVHTPF